MPDEPSQFQAAQAPTPPEPVIRLRRVGRLNEPDLRPDRRGSQVGPVRILLRGLSARDAPDDEKRLRTLSDRCWQERVRRFEGEVFLARVVAEKWTSLQGAEVPNGPPQNGVSVLQRLERRTQSDGFGNIQFDFALHASQRFEVIGNDNPDHGSVCTSIESTGGRWLTIADQVSPPYGET